MVDKIKIKKDLIQLSTSHSPYVVGYEGNVSARYTDKTFLVKASGKRMNSLVSDDLVECSWDSVPLDSKLRASMEAPFHSLILRKTGCNFVAHTHPPHSMRILCRNLSSTFANYRFFPDQVVFNGIKSCLVNYYHPGDELCKAIEKEYDKFVEIHGIDPKIILLKNHGIITWGKTIDECLVKTEICEKSAMIFKEDHKNICFLGKDEIKRILNDEKEKFRQNGE